MELPSFITRLFATKAATADRYPGTWESVGGGTADGVNTNNLLEANKEWVFVAVDRIASSVAGIRFKAMRYMKNGDDQEIFTGPLVDFLEKPGPDITGKDFIYLNTAYKELTGNAFWERQSGKRIAPLVPTRVSPIVEGGRLTGFKYNDGPTQRTITVDKVLHDRYPDLSRPYWGAGKLQKIAKWVDTSSYATEFLSRFFVNGATFGGFITTEEETEQRIKLIKMGLMNDHTGVANAHKIGVLPKGSDFKQTTAKMSDMEMGATDDRYRDKILSGFGVPKTLVGLTTEVNRASAEAAEYVYAKYTLKPIVDDFVEFMNTAVAPMLDGSGSYYYWYDEFIPDNQETKLKEREIALGKQPYMTINEVRASVGLPPVKDGDVVYANPMMQPLGSPAPTAEPDSGGDDDKDDDDKEPKKALPARARAAFIKERLVDNILEKAEQFTVAHDDPDASTHKTFVGRVDEHQKLIANKVRDFNNKQQRDVTQGLKLITKGISKGDLFDMDGQVELMIDFISPILQGLMIEQAIAEYLAQEFPGQFDQHNLHIKKVIMLAAKRVARSYNDTTAKLLEKALNEGISAGEDLTQLSARVQEVYAFSDAVRAEAVAHTEAFYIANEGSREAYRQSKVVSSLRWYTAEDEMVCEFCGPQNGKIVDIKEDFFPKGYELVGRDGGKLPLDYRAIDVPPLHTNCRCFVRPEGIDIN